jgi:RNA polymerase sigma factor (sigma-70 family)
VTDVDRLVNSHLWLVRAYLKVFARKLRKSCFRDDMESNGVFSLFLAAREYDHRRGRFENFASAYVRGACIDTLRSLNQSRRKNKTEAGELVADVATADAGHERADAKIDALGLLRLANVDERLAMRRHFLEEMPMARVAKSMGLTESRVCQLVHSGARRIRKSVAA